MLMHADLMLTLANDRNRELIAEAEKRQVLNNAREARRSRKAAEVRGRPTGRVASCEPSAVVPAR